MIITKEQSEIRLASDNNICNPNRREETQVEIIRKDGINNHTGGGKRLSEEERVAIATLASLTDSETAAAVFGIHSSHANDLKNGNRNVGNGESGSSLRIRDQELLKAKEGRLEDTKLTIQERAAEKLLGAFGLFDSPEFQEQLLNSKPKEVASVMKDMSQVMRNLSTTKTNEVGNGKNNIKITLHSPKTANESAFDVIEIGV